MTDTARYAAQKKSQTGLGASYFRRHESQRVFFCRSSLPICEDFLEAQLLLIGNLKTVSWSGRQSLQLIFDPVVRELRKDRGAARPTCLVSDYEFSVTDIYAHPFENLL